MRGRGMKAVWNRLQYCEYSLTEEHRTSGQRFEQLIARMTMNVDVFARMNVDVFARMTMNVDVFPRARLGLSAGNPDPLFGREGPGHSAQ